ncbi:exodeoxyribonuclease VII, small subunit [marine gamma proteobacterium HTCC2148]|nr:exodeoxyribonuclease VII, small subunit [marine gamma proteobacterium HTCC2148]
MAKPKDPDGQDKNTSIEEAVRSLERVISALEDSDIPLNSALSKFEEGIGLSRKAQETLSDAEQRVNQLTASGSDSAGPVRRSSNEG